MKRSGIKTVWSAFCRNFFVKAIASWLFIGALFVWVGTPFDGLSLEFTDVIPFPLALLAILACIVLLTVLDYKRKSELPGDIGLLVSMVLFAGTTVAHSVAFTTYLTIALFTVLTAAYFFRKYPPTWDLPKKWQVTVSVVFVAGVTLAVILTSVLRYRTYSSPNYDFGIFCQMFHRMKTDLLPLTTCERDQLLSHFAVHLSPIYYLLLPVYAVFPSPITLEVAQGLVLYSGAIPLYLLCKRFDLSRLASTGVLVAYALYPAIACGTLYDLHENCFLLPLLLWFLYAYEARKNVWLTVFSLLVLLVKEDAFLYLAVFAVFVLIDRKDFRRGAVLLVGSLCYFGLAVWFLKTSGLGIMSGRFSNLIADDSGLLGVVRTVLLNPGYAAEQMLTDSKDSFGRFTYLLQLFLPLALVPFLSKRPARYILLLPILVNLMAQYPYMHELRFQYNFGITAFLFYLVILNLKELKPATGNAVSMVAVLLSGLLFVGMFMPSFVGQITNYLSYREQYKQMDALLSEIPKDASVVATAFLVPHLADREEVYEVEYHPAVTGDYVVIDLRFTLNDKIQERQRDYLDAGYVCIREEPDLLAVYQRPDL